MYNYPANTQFPFSPAMAYQPASLVNPYIMQQSATARPAQNFNTQALAPMVRTVGNIEEAKATPADFSGIPTFFHDKAAGKIYIKYIDLNGLTVFEIYERSKQEATSIQQQEDNSINLAKEIEELKKELQALKNSLGG